MDAALELNGRTDLCCQIMRANKGAAIALCLLKGNLIQNKVHYLAYGLMTSMKVIAPPKKKLFLNLSKSCVI